MTPRRIDEVRPGHYRYRRVRGGPWLPAVVTIEDGMIYVVEADESLRVGITRQSFEDMLVDAVMNGTAFENNLVRVLWFGESIDKAEYDHMLSVLAWARENHPEHPMLHPDRPIQMSEVKVSSIF